MSNKPNKFDMINVVNISTLDAKDKILLVELIMRSNIETNEAFPGVASRYLPARAGDCPEESRKAKQLLPRSRSHHGTPAG